MKRMWLLTVLCLIPLVGCYRQTYISLPQPPGLESAASTGTETDSSYVAGGTAAATAGAAETAAPTQPVSTAPPETQPSATAGTTETGGEPSSEPTAGDPGGESSESPGPSASQTEGSGGSRDEESKPTEPPATSPPPTVPSPPPVTTPPPVTAPPPVTEAPSAPPAGGDSISAGLVLALINQARSNAGLSPLGSDGALAGLGGSWDGSGTLLEYLLANGYDCSTAGTGGFSVTDDAYAAELLEEWILSSGGEFLSPAYTRVGIDLRHSGNYILIALYYAG